jgi:hypothetical protein
MTLDNLKEGALAREKPLDLSCHGVTIASSAGRSLAPAGMEKL